MYKYTDNYLNSVRVMFIFVNMKKVISKVTFVFILLLSMDNEYIYKK